MKVFLVFPKFYSLATTIKRGFNKLGNDVEIIDYEDLRSSWKNKFDRKTSGLPYRFRKYWIRKFINEINRKYLEYVQNYKPDLIIVYNNQLILPEIIQTIRKKCKIGFYLGDNPYYTHTSDYNLAILNYADFIFSPDTFWIEQLSKIGINNFIHDVFGYNPELNFIKDPTDEEQEKYGNDIVFIGRNYTDAAGYKRTLFFSKFSNLDLKIYGSKEWLKWLPYFPELKEKFILNTSRLSFELINIISNCSKIYPIENNPGLFNGIHMRVFDCIGSGILPLPEYSKDIDIFFKDINFPVIKDYNEAAEIAQYYLNHEDERQEIINCLRNHVHKNYMPEHAAQRVIEYAFT